MERKPRERRIKLENMEKNVFIPSYISNLPQQWPNYYFLTEILHQILFKVLCSFIFYLNEINWRHRTLLGWGAARLKACHFNQQRIKSSSSMGFRARGYYHAVKFGIKTNFQSTSPVIHVYAPLSLLSSSFIVSNL